MAYITWFLLIFPSLLMDVVGRVFAPMLPFFAQADGYLPPCLSWFQTPDNPLDGDAGHWERWPGNDAWSTYKRRVAWLLRNVGYGFNINCIGLKVKASDLVYSAGDERVGDQSGVSGTCRWFCYRNGKLVGWQFYFCHHYRIFGHWKCVRIGAGWKLWGPTGVDRNCQHWTYFNLLKSSWREQEA